MMRLLLVLTIFGASSLALAQQTRPRRNLNEENEGKVTYSTKLDFDSALIDGEMKVPEGFLLQGRNKQSLTNMVRLRSDFKPELRKSRSAVKSLAH